MQMTIQFLILAASLLAAAVTSPDPVLAQSGSAGGSIGNDEKSLSGSRSVPSVEREAPKRKSHKAEEPRRASRGGGGGGNFDGTWAYVGVGTNCQGSGSGTITISGGVVRGQGGSGQVSPSGAYHAAAVGEDGVALTASGRLTGNSGSGSYRRADGCVGVWTARRM